MSLSEKKIYDSIYKAVFENKDQIQADTKIFVWLYSLFNSPHMEFSWFPVAFRIQNTVFKYFYLLQFGLHVIFFFFHIPIQWEVWKGKK